MTRHDFIKILGGMLAAPFFVRFESLFKRMRPSGQRFKEARYYKRSDYLAG